MSEDVRCVPCDTCGQEGRIYRQHVIDPYNEIDHGECPDCRGTGSIEVPVVPVGLADLSAPSKGLCRHGYDVDRGVLCPVCDS